MLDLEKLATHFTVTRARRLTRKEKRKIKHSPRPEVEDAKTYRANINAARNIDDPWPIHDPDKALDEPMAHQPRPNTALARPSFPPKRTQAFAKTEPYHHSYSDLAVEAQRRTAIKFGRVPEKKFIAPNRPKKADITSLQRIIDEEDARRASAQGTMGLYSLLHRVIQYDEAMAVREYFRTLKPEPQARAWRYNGE